MVTTCLQLTTSSILNLCRSAFCFSGCSVPCHFRPFLCLGVEGCFMLKGFFMLHLLLTFPPHPSFPKELYISCREKYYILVQNSHVPKSNSDFFLSSIHPSAESVFPSGWIKTALSFAPLVQYSPPLSSHAHQGLSQKLRSHPPPSPSAAIRADNQNEKMPPKPAGTLWLLFAPTCFLSRASLHPDLSQSPISAPCRPTMSLFIHSLHNSQLQCLHNGSLITPVLKNLTVVFQGFKSPESEKFQNDLIFFPVTSQISSWCLLP